jgi:hypothetical protein
MGGSFCFWFIVFLFLVCQGNRNNEMQSFFRLIKIDLSWKVAS